MSRCAPAGRQTTGLTGRTGDEFDKLGVVYARKDGFTAPQ